MSSDCVFCRIVTGQESAWKVREDGATYAFLDISPFSEFHTLVVPKHHFESVFDLPPDEMAPLSLGVKAVVDLLALKIGLTDVQILNSSGVAAQQDVFHVHFHVVPRAKGDGQDIRRTTHPEWRSRFDALLNRLA
jgi:histidine triad (HIT) family protein